MKILKNFFVIAILFFAKSASAQQFVKIAMAQIFCLDSDKSGNFKRIENAIKEAKAKGAEIVVFPEMALLGWVNPDAHHMAESIPGKDADFLASLAKKYNVMLCIGLGESDRDRLYDSAILIDEKGEILLKHRKNNILSELMEPPYTPGNGVQVVETKFGKIGVLICADTFQENLLIQMSKLQPDLMLIPYGWAAKTAQWPEHGEELHNVVKNVAKKLQCPVIGTDLVGQISKGPWKGLTYGGQSIAVDKNANTLKIAADRDREVVVVDVEI